MKINYNISREKLKQQQYTAVKKRKATESSTSIDGKKLLENAAEILLEIILNKDKPSH